jgi:hypothetical protein
MIRFKQPSFLLDMTNYLSYYFSSTIQRLDERFKSEILCHLHESGSCNTMFALFFDIGQLLTLNVTYSGLSMNENPEGIDFVFVNPKIHSDPLYGNFRRSSERSRFATKSLGSFKSDPLQTPNGANRSSSSLKRRNSLGKQGSVERSITPSRESFGWSSPSLTALMASPVNSAKSDCPHSDSANSESSEGAQEQLDSPSSYDSIWDQKFMDVKDIKEWPELGQTK